MFPKSRKYDELISLYTEIAENGVTLSQGKTIEHAYGVQEAAKFRHEIKRLFELHDIGSVLDYGAGATPWSEKSIPEGGDLLSFTGATEYVPFEPARNKTARPRCDAVVSFDVLEHVFVADVGYVLNDIFKSASKLVVLNVALYPARALLSNGENAHITLRSAQWWRGAVELVASSYPDIAVSLYVCKEYGHAARVLETKMAEVISAPGYTR